MKNPRPIAVLFLMLSCLEVHADIIGGVLVNKETHDVLGLTCSKESDQNTTTCDEISLHLFQNNTLTAKTVIASPSRINDDFLRIAFAMAAKRRVLNHYYQAFHGVVGLASMVSIHLGIMYQIFKRADLFTKVADPKIANFKQFVKTIVNIPKGMSWYSEVFTKVPKGAGVVLGGSIFGGIAALIASEIVEAIVDQAYTMAVAKRFEKHLKYLLNPNERRMEKLISNRDFIATNSILVMYGELVKKASEQEEQEEQAVTP